MATYPHDLSEATSLLSYALDCMSTEDYPPASEPFPQLEAIATNPSMGFIEVTLPGGAGIEIQVTYFPSEDA